MYFIVNLKMEKPMLCFCFQRIVFIELNFTVAFLLIRKTWDDQFTGEVGVNGLKRAGLQKSLLARLRCICGQNA